MPVATRAVAAVSVLALGLGGALVVAAPVAALPFIVTTNADDGLPGSLTYALANLVPGGNTITIQTTGPITIPGAIPDITEAVDIVGPVGGVTIETTDTADHFIIDSATVSMTDVDIRPNLGGIDQGIEVTDSALTLTRVSVEGFDQGITADDSTLTATDVSLVGNATIGLSFGDTVGTNSVSLTDVALGGTTLDHVDRGALLFGSGGAISLTNVRATFTDNVALAIASDGGDVLLDTVTVQDAGVGIQLAAVDGSVTTARHVKVDRTAGSAISVILDDAQFLATDVNVDSAQGDGIDVTAVNGSVIAIAASSAKGSSESGFYFDTTDSTVTLSTSTASGNGLGGGCGCGSGAGVEVYSDASTVTIDGVTTSGNTAPSGAGILSDTVTGASTLTIRGTTVSGNHSTFGAGIYLGGVDGASTVLITGSTITDNIASDDGGGIMVDGLADDGTSVTISDSTLTLNRSTDYGAGIYLLDIGNAVVSTARVTILRTTVDHNIAGGYGGGIAINEPSVETTGEPTVLIDSSTISNNTTPYGGGGVYARKLSSPDGAVVKILNSTISTNDAQGGGGVSVDTGNPGTSALTMVVSHSTVFGNSAHTNGGIGTNPGDNTLLVDNSIVAGSTSNNGNTPDDLDAGSAYTVTFSLVQSPKSVVAPGSGNIVGVDPQLGPLAGNGGPTQTHLVSPGSPAYNAGDPAFVGTALVDQRGMPRVYQILDIGAVEWQPALARTGEPLTPGPRLIALLLLFSGIAMVAFSRLGTARSVG